MRICNYSLGNNYDKFGRVESNQIILARPGKRVLGVINGVEPDSCHVDINLNNTWVLDFDVNRIVDGNICNFYDRIEQKMELHLPGYGWFKITEEPVMSNNGNYEMLSVHAESLEIEFQQYVLKGFECNTGTTASLEYLAADNIYYLNDAGEEFLPEYDDGTYYPLFRENVRFYRDTADWETMMAVFATTDGSEQALLGMVHDYPVIMDCWRINYNLDNFDAAIQYAIDNGNLNAKARSILRSYLGNVKDQQTAYNLTHVYPDILTYLTNPANSMVADINYKSFDFSHREDYTLAEIMDLELQRQKDLSLLDIIANHYGWKVGFVDDYVMPNSDIDDDRIPLDQKTGMFQVDSENAYTFMTQEMASYFRCVFVFDSYEKTVNVYNINNIGIDTNIFLSFHNIQNSVERSGNDVIRTAFYVEGGDDLTPIEANFGSNEIWDLSYYMNLQHFAQATIDKYNAWLEYRETQRQPYMDLAVQYRDQLEVVSELYDRVPVDSSDNTQYGTMTDEELLEEKAKNEALVAGIEATYVDGNGNFDIDILQQTDPLVYQEYLIITGSVLSSPRDALEYLVYDANAGDGDYGDYVFVNGAEDTSDYRLGNIDTTIFNRKLTNGGFIDDGDDPATIKAKNYYKHQREYLDDYIYDFDTYGDAYGVAELQNRLDDLENKYTTLWSKGYGQPSEVDEDDNPTDPYHEKQYQLYLKYKNAYDECKQVLEERTAEYDDARDTLQGIADDMAEIAENVDITNDRFGFTQAELDLIDKYVYYTDYSNENMITTSISTNEEIVETEYQLIKDAQEELYAVAHPQWVWNTTQDNLFIIVDNDDWYGNVPHPTYDEWRNDLMIGNYIHVGFREDDHLPDFVYVDSSSNQVKLRLISIGLNPFMIEPTIDLTFSSMIQYKSRRNDFVDLLGLASGVGDHQVTATFQSKKLDNTFEIDSSFVMKLLKNGAFQNYAAGSIMNSGTLDSLVVPTIHATNINVDQIDGNIAHFMETYTQYLNADTIVTQVITADNGYFQTLVANTINATEGQLIHLTSTNASIDAEYVASLVAGRISVDDLIAGDITLSNSMRILSDNGLLEMNGDHLIISMDDGSGNLVDGIQLGYSDQSLPYLKFCALDDNGDLFTGIQLGYASNGYPNLIIRDENNNSDSGIVIGFNSIASGSSTVMKPSITIYDDEGAALFTSHSNNGLVNGVQAAAISNGLIVNDMVHTQTLSKDKMNFNVMEVGDDIIIEQMTYTDGSKFGNEYTTFEQDITNAVAEFVDVVPSVELSCDREFTVDADSNILPSRITVYANPRNGFVPYTWTIDGVNASQYVASDGLSINVPNTALASVSSVVVRCQNQDNSSYDTITLYKLPSYNSAITTIALDNDVIQFATSANGVPMFRQTATSKITVYKGSERFYNFTLNNVVAPTGVTATASADSIEIVVSPTAVIPTTGTITFDVVLDGSTTISKSITVNRLLSTAAETTVVEYTIQNTNLSCSDTATWSEVRPVPTAGEFLWYRYRTDYANNDPSKYSDPHYISTIAGLINMTDAVNKSITNKIWQDDFETYDTQVIRHRESEISQTVDAISMTVSETVSDISGIHTTMSSFTQTVDGINMTITNINDDINGLAGDISDLNNDINGINGSITGLTGNITQLTNNVQQIADNLAGLDQSVDNEFQILRSEFNQSLGEISSTVTGISSDIDELTGNINGLTISVSNISQRADEITQSVTRIDGDIFNLNGSIDGLNDDITGLNGDISGLSDDIAGLNGSIADLSLRYLQTASDLATTAASLSELSIRTDNQFDAVSSRITETAEGFERTIIGINGDISTLGGNYASAIASLNALNDALDAASVQLNSQISNLNDAYQLTAQDYLLFKVDVNEDINGISTTVSGITTELDVLSSSVTQLPGLIDSRVTQVQNFLENDIQILSSDYQQTANEFHWMFYRSDPTDLTSDMTLTADGLSLINGSITISTENIITEGALQVRSLHTANMNTDENEPIETDEEEQIVGVGFTTLQFDNGYADDDPNRDDNPYISFLGHLVYVDPFDIELSDSIINSTTQFVVCEKDNDTDYQYVVWYDKDTQSYKSICNNYEYDPIIVSTSTNHYEITPFKNGDVNVVFRYDGNILEYPLRVDGQNFDISGTLTYGYRNGDISQTEFNLSQGNYAVCGPATVTDYVIFEFTIPSAIKNTTYSLNVRLGYSSSVTLPFDVITCNGYSLGQTYIGLGSVTDWEWDNDTHMVVAEFTKESDGDVTYQSYYPAKTYQAIQQTVMLQVWGYADSLTESTTINGGHIQTDTITSAAINTNGIQSRDYHQTPISNEYELLDQYVLTPDGSIDYILLEQLDSKNYKINVEANENLLIRMRYNATLPSGYTFYYSIDYPYNDFSAGGGYSSSDNYDPSEEILPYNELTFESTNDSYTFDESATDIVFYISLPSATKGETYNLTAYLSNGTTDIGFTSSGYTSITCNNFVPGQTRNVTFNIIDDVNVMFYYFDGDCSGKTLVLTSEDINAEDIESITLKCWDSNTLELAEISLTSSSQDNLQIEYTIPQDMISEFNLPSSYTMDQMDLTLVVNNMINNNNYIIQSYIINDDSNEYWYDIVYRKTAHTNQALPHATETIMTDPTYSDTGTWFNLKDSGFIRSKNFSIDADGNAYFKGTLHATDGEIGGWSIDNILYYQNKYPSSSSMVFSPNGVVSTSSVGASSGQQTWLLTARDKFGITTNGDIYASGNFQFGGANGIRYNAITGKVTLGSNCVIGWDQVDGGDEYIAQQTSNFMTGTQVNYAITHTEISANQITTGTIGANRIAAGSITANKLDIASINAAGIVAGSVSANGITAGNISGCTFTQIDRHGNASFSSVDGGAAWGSLNSTTTLANGVVTTGAVNTQIITDTVDGTLDSYSHLIVHGCLSSTMGVYSEGLAQYGAQFYLHWFGVGTLLRNDGNNFHILVKDTNTTIGAWNSLRPFNINLSTGVCNVNTSSDIRLKDILGIMSDDEAITILNNVDIYNYNYKNDKDKITRNGIIAQQLRDVMIDNNIGYRPYITINDNTSTDSYYDLSKSEDNITYGIDYGQLSPLLWKGWQIHEKKVRELEKEIDELKQLIKQLTER